MYIYLNQNTVKFNRIGYHRFAYHTHINKTRFLNFIKFIKHEQLVKYTIVY